MNRYALVDKRGKNRGTCSAKHFAAAEKAFVKQRGGKGIPEGWAIEIRLGRKVVPAMKEAFKHRDRLAAKPEGIAEVMREIKEIRADVAAARRDLDAVIEERDGALARVKVAEAQRDAARAALASAEERLQDRRILATQIADIKALVRSWKAADAVTVASMLYSLQRVMGRKD